MVSCDQRGRLPDVSLDGYGVANHQSACERATCISAMYTMPATESTLLPAWDLWPAEPLLSRLTSALATLQLPRFVQRHPELADAVLRSLLRLVLEFEEKQMEQAMDAVDAKEDKDAEEDGDKEREEIEPGKPPYPPSHKLRDARY